MKRSLALCLIAVTFALISGCKQKKEPGTELFQHEIITGDNTENTQALWDRFFDTPNYVYGKDPIPFLKENIRKLLPGKALVLAMGEGRNAVFLARNGFRVEGIDISEVALSKARRLAKEFKVNIATIRGNLKDYQIAKNSYDFILNVTYFRASIIPAIKAGLKKGGYVMFENFTVDHLKNPTGMSIPTRFLVKPGELKGLFRDFEIVAYRETNDGKQALVQLLAKKP